jgi:hypothetical protein
MRNNKLTEINGEIFQSWSNIEKLYLGKNLLKNISEDIGYCNQLVELDISRYFPASNAMFTIYVLLAVMGLKFFHLHFHSAQH